jgi:hypothetical protein
MTTLTTGVTRDFSGLNTIDILHFPPAPLTPITATFLASPFDGTHIHITPTLQGGTGFNHLVMNQTHEFSMAA